MKTSMLTLLLLSVLSWGNAQDTAAFFDKADHFFKEHVVRGTVDYKQIKTAPEVLDDLLKMASQIKVSKDNAAEYQAFWINSYNLSVIQGIVQNYPIAQPLQVAGFFDKITYAIGGTEITLNAIENTVLRGNFPQEARFHFVLVCAGLGCPPIIDEAYRPATLEAQLQRQTEAALNDPNFIRVNKNKVKISQLFEWYKSDFEQEGSITDFINTYRAEKLPDNGKISYYPYDWNLNDRK